MISAIFACEIREAIISVLTELAASLRRSLNRAEKEKEKDERCRERAACALISRRCGSTNDHRDLLQFVQEVARFVTSHFFGKKFC